MNDSNNTTDFASYSDGFHQETEPEVSELGGHANPAVDSLGAIVQDIELFARNWVGRIRQLIQRSSQLIERETLLAGAIARLDQQKAEWKRRTEDKEAGLLEQSKLLTEGWLEVEAERRKAMQGARSSSGHKTVGPVTAAGPVQAIAGAPIVAPPVVMPGQPGQPTPAKVSPAVESNRPVQPDAGGPATPGPLPVAPVIPVSGATASPTLQQPESVAADPVDEEASAEASRSRIEEFKRMQRAIRSNRNR